MIDTFVSAKANNPITILWKALFFIISFDKFETEMFSGKYLAIFTD